MNDEEIKELLRDTEHLCKEVSKFLNKWRDKLFRPLVMALEMLEVWLDAEYEKRSS